MLIPQWHFSLRFTSQGEQGPSRREQEEQAQQREALRRQQEVERQRGPGEDEA